MTLVYPTCLGTPIIFVGIENLVAGSWFLFPMLLDTGADETCFPAKYAAFFGHTNRDPRVKQKRYRGVGGSSLAYLHSIRLSLLDPEKSTRSKHVIAWTAKTKSSSFLEKLDLGCGLLGMDIIKQWKSVCFENAAKGLQI